MSTLYERTQRRSPKNSGVGYLVPEANFLVNLMKCPKCGEYGVRFGHFGVSKTSYGWLGVKCIKCGWIEVNEELTKQMLIDNQKLKKFVDRKRKEKTHSKVPQDSQNVVSLEDLEK